MAEKTRGLIYGNGYNIYHNHTEELLPEAKICSHGKVVDRRYYGPTGYQYYYNRVVYPRVIQVIADDPYCSGSICLDCLEEVLKLEAPVA